MFVAAQRCIYPLRQSSLSPSIDNTLRMRTIEDMQKVLNDGAADAISMCRPFIMNPSLVEDFRQGLTNRSACTSCNKCMETMREGRLRCILV